MTDPERTAWLALYAVAWFQSTGIWAGCLDAEQRALIAAERADAGLEALKVARPEVLQ